MCSTRSPSSICFKAEWSFGESRNRGFAPTARGPAGDRGCEPVSRPRVPERRPHHPCAHPVVGDDGGGAPGPVSAAWHRQGHGQLHSRARRDRKGSSDSMAGRPSAAGVDPAHASRWRRSEASSTALERARRGSVDALERALLAGRVEDLEGLGRRSSEKILRAISDFRSNQGRYLLSEVDQLVEPLVTHMKAARGSRASNVAGSYRRRKETVGDVDLLVLAESPGEDVIEHFLTHPSDRTGGGCGRNARERRSEIGLGGRSARSSTAILGRGPSLLPPARRSTTSRSERSV